MFNFISESLSWDSTNGHLALSPQSKQEALLLTKSNFKCPAFWDFPGGPKVKNLPSNVQRTGIQSTKTPQVAGQLSPAVQLEKAHVLCPQWGGAIRIEALSTAIIKLINQM